MPRRPSKKIGGRKPCGEFPPQPTVTPPSKIRLSETEEVHIFAETTPEEGTTIKLRVYRVAQGIGPYDQKPNGVINLPIVAAREVARYITEQAPSNLGGNALLRVESSTSSYPRHKQATRHLEQLIKKMMSPELRDAWHHQGLPWAIENGFLSYIRLQYLANAVAKLEILVQKDCDQESEYQRWCENNIWAFGNYYVCNGATRRMSTDIADMIPETINGHKEIIELKTPTVPLLVAERRKHGNIWHFSSNVSEAIGQCIKYICALREKINDYPVWNPHATIVIGRAPRTDEENKALMALNSHLHGITVITYDHLIKQARQTLDVLRAQVATRAQEATASGPTLQ